MDTKKKILIIHPEGNIFNNPNLLAIANYLSDDFDVDVLMPQFLYTNESKFEMIVYKPIWNKIKNRINYFLLYKLLFIFFSSRYTKKYDFIFGVDRIGIIDAYLLSKKNKCNYALISYEILFKDETSQQFKEIEITSCQKISFAIVQDELRGRFLVKENKINDNKLIFIPVASDGFSEISEKKNILHKIFNLPPETNILIFTGSVAQWTSIDEILEQANDFLPPNWALVIHDRYGKARQSIHKMKLDYTIGKNIFLIEDSIFSFEDLNSILSDAVLGIVSYRPVEGSPYTGKNIQHIGLASGKFSTYMKNGLPTLVYRADELGEIVTANRLGFFVNDLKNLRHILENFEGRDKYETHCQYFFNTTLSFENYKNILKSKIELHIE
ncbi:hypothetical protein [Acinetobacter sp. YH12136]|uniref:hypothetical protein n=1 Tax=Acinetobacter sp. YH12136 TaxID=2601120 RepID=UPI0015D1A0D1|nr:hypothetical protein [Acinetobacter sp. YH12136]